MNKIGFWVEEKYYGTRVGQANAFAQHRANQYSRPVDVTFVNADGTSRVEDTKKPVTQAA